jgi:hypothetical protein
VSPGEALRGSLVWHRFAISAADWEEAVEAARRGLAAVGTLLAGQGQLAGRIAWLRVADGLASSAARAHHALGEPAEAVTVLETGRSLMAADLVGGERLTLDRLRSTGRGELARRFAEAYAAWTAATDLDTDVPRAFGGLDNAVLRHDRLVRGRIPGAATA